MPPSLRPFLRYHLQLQEIFLDVCLSSLSIIHAQLNLHFVLKVFNIQCCCYCCFVLLLLLYVWFMYCHKRLQTISYSYLCLLSYLTQCHSHKQSVNICRVELALWGKIKLISKFHPLFIPNIKHSEQHTVDIQISV